MRFTEACLRLAYRVVAKFFYGSGANADWIYEKVQRPFNVSVQIGRASCRERVYVQV
jgi:hypothetical protein